MATEHKDEPIELKLKVTNINDIVNIDNDDNINHPSHYCEGRKYEPIDVINDWNVGYNLGNAIKYISRAGRKGDIKEDLQKAIFYIQYELKKYDGV